MLVHDHNDGTVSPHLRAAYCATLAEHADTLSRRSWFSKASASTSRLLSPSSHELPRWRTPSPMAASMIPPPIVRSSYVSDSKLPEKSVIVEKPTEAEDRQRELEADLQFLLDAQGEGLLQGLGNSLHDDQTSTGSTTPTARSYRSTSTKRATKPTRRKLGLKSVRKGIYNSILALSELKAEELGVIDEDIENSERTIHQIDEWEQKRKGLQEASTEIDDSEETVRVRRLQQEADTLQMQINEVEMQLAELKSRQRKILRQAAAVENSVQAKLASYKQSLSMLETDVERFLSLEPADATTRPHSRDGETSMWRLPPSRRTLDMAREHWKNEHEAVQMRKAAVDREKTALDNGATMWKNLVIRVTEYEKQVRTEVRTLSPTMSTNAWDEPPEQDPSSRMRQLLQALDSLIEGVETDLKTAQERDWRLLIAAIGAELDALKQGRQLLNGALRASGEDCDGPLDVDDNSANSPSILASQSDNHGSADLRQGIDANKNVARPVSSINGSSDADDDPDPELLFSHQEVEVEGSGFNN